MMRFLVGGVIGAALAYFLDPDKGSDRRQKLGPIKQKVGEAQKQAAPITSKAYGTVMEKVGRRPDNSNPDDATLRDRVESEVFRAPKTSREHINVSVVNGIVELRGQQPTQDDIDNLVKIVRDIANVNDVHNYLHTPGTPAPNKESAIQES